MDSHATAGSLPLCSQPPSLQPLHSCSNHSEPLALPVQHTRFSGKRLRPTRSSAPLAFVRARSGNVGGPRVPSDDGTASAPRLVPIGPRGFASARGHGRQCWLGAFAAPAPRSVGSLGRPQRDDRRARRPPTPRQTASVGRAQRARRRGGRATWLILPVVICLSQRLSHACVSMNYFRL